MAFEHESGLPNAFNRAKGKQELQSVVFFGERPFITGEELVDLQEIIRGRHDRVGRLIAKDGDRIEYAFSIVDKQAETVTLTEGKIYVAGDVFPVPEAVLEDVPMTGRVVIGVRLNKTWPTGEDDITLRGLVPGSAAEGEDTSAREVATIAWALETDDGPGTFYQVYIMQDGTLLDQTPPPILDGVNQALALYDRPNGNYIVSGHSVTTIGLEAGKQIFSIEEGEANVNGFKVTRFSSLRYAEQEVWDVGAVPGETHTYLGGASRTIILNEGPINAITSILLTKEKTVNLTRGALINGIDGLPDNSVLEIISIPGYTKNVDYKLTGNGVDWGLAGIEPAVGASYNPTYRYRASVTADSFTTNSVTVSGGATDGEVIIAYTYKLPRIDVLGILQGGQPVYIKGISAQRNPSMPAIPANVLALAEIHNNWVLPPTIISDGVVTGVRSMTWSDIARVVNRQQDHDRLIQLERLRSNVDRRDPAAKRNMFVDPFETDYYRDEGEVQNGAVGNFILQLAIEPTFYDTTLVAPVCLDWVEEVIVSQPLKSACVKINPYMNFTPLPGTLALTPAVDFWTERETQWTSPVTVEFQRGISWWGPQQTVETTVQNLGQSSRSLPFLRQRSVAFTISGFFEGEILDSLTFDGISVKPPGTQTANADGEISGNFTIPAGVTAGSKTVRAIGMGETVAEALFTGQGTLATDIMRRVTTINTWVAPPPQENNGGGGSSDPQAQIFLLPVTRQLVGVDFRLCAIGDTDNNILVHQVAVENGIPTVKLEAEALVPMAGAVVGWKAARYPIPVTTGNDRDHAFVIKTDDGDHSISIAGLEGFDVELQQAITTHPYPVGPRLSSVNARTWTPHQGEALTFRLVAARYPVTSKTVDLGTVDLVDCSDMQFRAAMELPSAQTSIVFEVERTNGDIYRMLPYQVWQLDEFITETVQLRAVLTGTNELSPILYAPVEFIAGRIETTAVYISRAFSIEDAVRISAYLKVALPAGSAAFVDYDLADDNWINIPVTATEISPDPMWLERNYRQADLAADLMRVRIRLTGGPAARPRAADFGLGAM